MKTLLILSFIIFLRFDFCFAQEITKPDFLNFNTTSNNKSKNLQFTNPTFKNAYALEQKLDSVRFVGNDGIIYEKSLFKYDSNGNCIDKIWYVYSNDDGLNKYRRYILSYDGSGNLVENSEQYWNSSSGKWENRNVNIYTYTDNKLLKEDYFDFNDSEDGKAVYCSTVNYSYNTHGEIVEEQGYSWNKRNQNGSAIEDEWEIHNTYNSQNQISESVFYYYDYMSESTFEPREKTIYEYDIAGNLINCNVYSWDEDQNSWRNGTLKEYIYDVNNNLIQAMRNSLDSEIKNIKDKITYDDNNNIISCEGFRFNSENEEWIKDFMLMYKYSNAGDVIEYKNYEIDSESDELVLFDYISYEYDEAITNETIALPDDMNKPIVEINTDESYGSVSYSIIKCNHKLMKAVYKIIDNFQVYGELQYHYSSLNTNSNIVISTDIRLYPNPTNSIVTIDNLPVNEQVSFTLYDMYGNKYFDVISNGVNQKLIDLQNLSNGTYFIKRNDSEHRTFKIIKN